MKSGPISKKRRGRPKASGPSPSAERALKYLEDGGGWRNKREVEDACGFGAGTAYQALSDLVKCWRLVETRKEPGQLQQWRAFERVAR